MQERQKKEQENWQLLLFLLLLRLIFVKVAEKLLRKDTGEKKIRCIVMERM